MRIICYNPIYSHFSQLLNVIDELTAHGKTFTPCLYIFKTKDLSTREKCEII